MANIEFLRIVFTIIVLIRHLFKVLGMWSGGWAGVIFFFILSGFFLAKTFKPQKSTLGVITNNLIRFVPLIATAACARCLFKDTINVEHLISEIFLINNTGILNIRPYCNVSWYLSVLFWVSLFYFYLMKTKKKETVNLTFGLIAFFGLVALHQRRIGVENYVGNSGDIGHLICMDVVYGMTMIAIGYFTWGLYEQLRKIIRPTIITRVAFSVIEFCVLTYSIVLMCFKKFGTNNFTFIAITLSALIILFSLKIGCVSRFFEKKIWVKLAKYCLAVYLIQGVILWELLPIFMDKWAKLFVDYKTLAIITTLLLCWLFGMWAHHVVEKPCTKFLKQLLSCVWKSSSAKLPRES